MAENLTFEYSEVVRREDGSLFELGCGAMGTAEIDASIDLLRVLAAKLSGPTTGICCTTRTGNRCAAIPGSRRLSSRCVLPDRQGRGSQPGRSACVGAGVKVPPINAAKNLVLRAVFSGTGTALFLSCMIGKSSLFLWSLVLALLAGTAPLARTQNADGAARAGGGIPAMVSRSEVSAAPVPEPTAAALLAIGGGIALMAALRRPPLE